MARGDITASEVYADREMLNRLGYGIFDVSFGDGSGVGFEDVRNFSYVVAQDEDPKLYRRKVFGLIGRYFPNDLAKAMWNRFVDHKWVMSEQLGREVDLLTAARDWYDKHSHQFLKDWTFQQKEVPTRIRNKREPQRGWASLVAGTFVPNLRELLNAGFSVTDIVTAGLKVAALPGYWRTLPRNKPKLRISKIFLGRFQRNKRVADKADHTDANWMDGQPYFEIKKLSPEEIEEGRYYARLVASLTGHTPKSKEEAERRWREILEHKWYMSERAGHDVGVRTAAIDYFRRLSLLQETETGHEA